MALGLITIVGIYLIFQADLSYRKGLIMAIGAAFLSAVFTVLNSGFVKTQHPYVISCWEMLGSSLATLAFLPFYIKYFADDGILRLNPTVTDWVYILILALVCTVYAYSASIQLK